VEDLISLVTHPSRYLGVEINIIKKDLSQVSLTICLAFPDVYEIGMSHLGLHILYHLLNARTDVAAERVYAPGLDMEQVLREKRRKLTSLESTCPVDNFDLLGFSLQYELSYTNIVNRLDLSGIPLYASQRSETFPLIIGGGPCAFNPEPLADFFDAFVIGDGEEVMLEISDCVIEAKREGVSKKDLLHSLARIEGVYIPSLFDVRYEDDGTVKAIIPLNKGYQRVTKRWVRSLDDAPFIGSPLVPYKQIVHDRLNLEIARGCTRGCRFCQAGPIYRPVRMRPPANISHQVETQLPLTGYDEISLLSLSSSDYTEIENLASLLAKKLENQRISVALPSLRPGSINPPLLDAISRVRKVGLTLAPEAGTERLRLFLRKDFPDDAIYDSVRLAFEKGWSTIKLYFMIGLPTETDEDLIGIANIIRQVYEIATGYPGKKTINITLSPFSPKPHTPLQWDEICPPEEILSRIQFIKKTMSVTAGTLQNGSCRNQYVAGCDGSFRSRYR